MQNAGDGGIIDGKVASGALDRHSNIAQEHANRYYKLVESMKTDCKHIAENTGFSEDIIQSVKSYVFIDEHDLDGGVRAKFYPNYEMAQSWQRMIDGKNIQPHDLTMIKHELLEMEYVKQGMTQADAHKLASKKYNYSKESEEYYDNLQKHKSNR